MEQRLQRKTAFKEYHKQPTAKEKPAEKNNCSIKLTMSRCLGRGCCEERIEGSIAERIWLCLLGRRHHHRRRSRLCVKQCIQRIGRKGVLGVHHRRSSEQRVQGVGGEWIVAGQLDDGHRLLGMVHRHWWVRRGMHHVRRMSVPWGLL